MLAINHYLDYQFIVLVINQLNYQLIVINN